MDDRERLEQVLAAYGADPQRWPEGDRKLAALSSEADRAEALEIDALLATARRPEMPANGPHRLARRLTPPSRGTVIAMPARPRFRPLWAGAALAASLAIGIYIGGSGLSDDLVDGVASVDDPLDLIGLGDAEALAEEDAA